MILVKDVEGVYSSDPDKVTNPQFIESLNGEEAEMLAAGGAKFLHVKALRYQSSGLRIRVTNLEKLDAGTVIKGELSPVQVEMLGEGVSMITFVGLNPEKTESIIRAAQAVREAHGDLLALSLETNAAIFYVGGGENVLESVHQVLVEDKIGKAVSEFPRLSMITVKGAALETERGVVQRITEAAGAGVDQRLRHSDDPVLGSGVRLIGPLGEGLRPRKGGDDGALRRTGRSSCQNDQDEERSRPPSSGRPARSGSDTSTCSRSTPTSTSRC